MQTLIGVSASTYAASRSTNDDAVKQASAASMPGIYTDNLAVNSVTDASTRRLTGMTTETAADTCNVAYTVTYNLAQLGYYNDPQSAYDSLITSLNTNIGNGNYNLYLQSAATNLGATSLTTVTSNAATYSGYTEITTTTDSTDDNSSGGNDDNNVGAIAGSIVGVVLFLAICVAVYMYFRASTASRDSDVAKSDSVGAPAVNAMFANPMAAPAAVAEPVKPRLKGEDENAGAVELADRS